MTRQTLDIFAVYAPTDKRRKPIVRWIAAVSTDDNLMEPADAFHGEAAKTLPPGAEYLSLMTTIPRGAQGHAETMARVNYHAGYPGTPA